MATNDCQRIVSGGMEGEVRIWKIGQQTQIMEASLKEHRGRVADVQITHNDAQAVSASYDGSCIIWDIVTHVRIKCLFESTMFKQVVFHPDESQLLTTGSDRKITYWDCFDGQAIRMLDGSQSGELNALAIMQEGEHFISGGEDKVVRLWDYDEGISYYSGVGHSGGITKVRIQIISNLNPIDCYLSKPRVHRHRRLRGWSLHLGHPTRSPEGQGRQRDARKTTIREKVSGL